MAPHQLADTFDRLARIDADDAVRPGRPHGTSWSVLADAVRDEALLDRWFEEHRQLWPGARRDVGGSYLTWAISRPVARPVAAALCTLRRAWTLPLDAISIHHLGATEDPEAGRFGSFAFDGDLLVTAEDPAATDPHVTVVPGDLGDLVERAAREIHGALAPVFAAVRRRAPFGLAGMWGAVADDIGVAATIAAEAGVPLADAVATTDRLTDELARFTGHMKIRPDLELVEWSGGVSPFSVKGNCCLWYRTEADPDPFGAGYCGTCPKRDRSTMLAEHRNWLEQQAAL